jgi:hypothetical protein
MRGNTIHTFSSLEDEKGKKIKESPLFFEEENPTKKNIISNEIGLNKFVWDLKYPGVTDLDGRQILWAGNTSGPTAVPGTYIVRMHIGDDMVGEQEFEVMKDPRLVHITQDDFIAQFELIQTINAKLDTTHKSINRIRVATEEMKTIAKEIEANEEMTRRLKELAIAINEIENALVQTKAEAIQDVLNFPIKLNNKLAALKNTVATGYGRPTTQQYAVFNELAEKVDVQLIKLNAIWNGEYEQVIEEIENPVLPINR